MFGALIPSEKSGSRGRLNESDEDEDEPDLLCLTDGPHTTVVAGGGTRRESFAGRGHRVEVVGRQECSGQTAIRKLLELYSLGCTLCK